jgi:hypothetical protein
MTTKLESPRKVEGAKTKSAHTGIGLLLFFIGTTMKPSGDLGKYD